MPRPRVVVSYARTDRRLVRGGVDYLRSAFSRPAEGVVFWDGDFIAGENWFQQFKASVNRATAVYVFWCRHASRSRWVAQELAYAFKRRKRVIPVMIDSTPLGEHLAMLHAVDWRRLFTHPPLVKARRSGARMKVAYRKAVSKRLPARPREPFRTAESRNKAIARFRRSIEAVLREE
jgi:TIR domain